MWSPSQSINSFFNFTSTRVVDKSTERQMHDVLDDLNKSANMLIGDSKFQVNWSKGESPFDNNSFSVSPDSLLNQYKSVITGDNYYNALDALHGRVIIGAQVRKNVSESEYVQFQCAEDVVKRTFQTVQESKAVEAIKNDWPGFQPYLDRHANATRMSKSKASSFCSSEANVDALENIVFNANYNYLNPSDPIVHGSKVDDLVEQFNQMIDGSVQSIEEATRWLHDQLKAESKPEQNCDKPKEDKGDQQSENKSESDGSPMDEDNEDKGQEKKEDKKGGKKEEKKKPKFIPSLTDKDIFSENVSTKMPQLNDEEEEQYGNCDLDDMKVVIWDEEQIANRFDKADWTSNVGEAQEKYNLIVKSGSNQIRQIAKVFQFEDSVPTMLSYGASAGDLDDNAFFKIRMGEFDRIYQVKDAPKQDDHLIGLLLDQSGSMRDSRIEEARKVLIYLLEGIKTYKTLKTVVMGHTAQYESFFERNRNNTLDMIPYITPSHGDNRHLLAVAPAIANNIDGSAILEIGKQMMQVANVNKKFLIHISDGEPSADGYDDGQARKHTKASVDKLIKQGIKVFGIGIENAFSHHIGRKLYGEGNFIVLNDTNSSLGIMVKKLKSFLLK